MKYYLPVTIENGSFKVPCPLEDGKLVRLLRDTKNRCCMPYGTISYGVEYCEHYKGGDSDHPKVKYSDLDYVEVCDIPKEEVTLNLFEGG